ncbi:transposase, partial [Pseudomonadota bacterium]
LHEYSIQHEVSIHSFVLMTNHVHLLMTPETKAGISELMQSVGRYYVRYINQTYHRTGTLWEGRFKSTLVDSERYFLVVSRYIELNPVRAAMADQPASYPWSSYQANALGKRIRMLKPHECYLSLGATTEERTTAYRALFKHHIPEFTLKQIRDAVNKCWALGDENFIKQIEKQTGVIYGPVPRGGDRKSKQFSQRSS